MLSTCHEHTFNKIYWIKEEKRRRAMIPNKFKEKGKEYRTVYKKIQKNIKENWKIQEKVKSLQEKYLNKWKKDLSQNIPITKKWNQEQIINTKGHEWNTDLYNPVVSTTVLWFALTLTFPRLKIKEYIYYTIVLKCLHKITVNDIQTCTNSEPVPKGNFVRDYVLYVSQITTGEEWYIPKEVQNKNYH